jgi:hypothetical protein
MDNGDIKDRLSVEPIKMTRKVSFRDENEDHKPLVEVHYVENIKSVSADESRSCLKCQLL